MSDYRVIAAATLTLQNLLLDAIREAAPGATVKTGPPEVLPPEEVGEGLINIFLFRMEPNKVWRNEELPFRRADGTLSRKPQLAVDLHYLLSFYGDERRKIPYLLLGLALSALHAEPYPSLRHMPRRANGDPGDDMGQSDPVSLGVAGSGLENQTHPLSFTFLPLSHDELIPLFSQIPYVMSVAYRASVLLIEPLAVPQPSLPVRRAELVVSVGRPPVLAGVSPQLLPYGPDARIELKGERLGSPSVRVLFGTLEADPTVEPDGSLSAPLPEGIQAGTHLVRVAHLVEAAGMPRRWTVESNPVALVIEPAVVEAVQTSTSGAASGGASAGPAMDSPGSGAARKQVGLRVRFAPAVSTRVPALVLLNEPAQEGREPQSYAFQEDIEPTAPDLITIQAEMEPGDYLVRVQVNGVTSRLRVDTDPTSPTFDRYNGPRMKIV